MITIVHGDDIVSSRKFLSNEKQRLKSFVVFEAETLTISNLAQNIKGKGLFEDKIAVIIENFFSKKLKLGKEIKDIIEFINKNKSSDIFFWDGKEITKRSLSIFPKAIEQVFKYPQKLFIFLDSLKPNNAKISLYLFHKALENIEVELIFYMLIRQFRLLLGTLDTGGENIEEITRLALWQKNRLRRQASQFTRNNLKTIYRKLYDMDVLQKTGGLNFKLTQAIDFFLLEI